MKKIIIFGILVFVLIISSVLGSILILRVELKKPNDLKNCVIILKQHSVSDNNCNFIGYMNLNDSTEYRCNVSKYWLDEWNVGDTIK